MGGEEYDNEKPVHPVRVSDFYMGKHLVTQGIWKAVMGNKPSDFRGELLPVDSLSWEEIQYYIQLLNLKTEREYLLPTEAQWEYAARKGLYQEEVTYAGRKVLEEVAWYGSFEKGNASYGSTMPAALKSPYTLNINDMSASF